MSVYVSSSPEGKLIDQATRAVKNKNVRVNKIIQDVSIRWPAQGLTGVRP